MIYKHMYDSPRELFQLSKSLAMTGQSSHKGDSGFTGTESFEEAVALTDNGWNPSELKAKAKSIGLRAEKHRMSTKKDNRGSTLLIDRYTEGSPDCFRRKYREPKEDKHIPLIFEVNEPAMVSKNQMFLKASVIAQVVENLRKQGISTSIYAYFAIHGYELEIIEAVPVKKRSERLQIHKLGAMMHPSSFRRIYFGRLENGSNGRKSENNVLKDWQSMPFGSGYGMPTKELSTNAVQFIKDSLKIDRAIIISSIHESSIKLRTEEDAAKWVNKIVDDCNAMFK
jgi:hypothetical protein